MAQTLEIREAAAILAPSRNITREEFRGLLDYSRPLLFISKNFESLPLSSIVMNDHMCGVYAAEYLLKNTELSIKEIAYRLGCSSPFHFSNLFRERRGLSPSSFRERSLKNMQISSTPADVPETPHPPKTC